ncbi:hypothetical protein HK101_001967 [Irineochytrium annulatum]|nr:hypothetical protein HK101_001967 [Irineochytrium annulatum]
MARLLGNSLIPAVASGNHAGKKGTIAVGTSVHYTAASFLAHERVTKQLYDNKSDVFYPIFANPTGNRASDERGIRGQLKAVSRLVSACISTFRRRHSSSADPSTSPSSSRQRLSADLKKTQRSFSTSKASVAIADSTGTGTVMMANSGVDTSERLTKLRGEMRKRDLAAYIVPSEDAHQSEYIAGCDARRAFISGFTGSAGLAVVTLDSAALWTDGRYFLQASKQLDTNWTLMKTGLPDVPSKEDWLVQVLPAGSNVGLDPTLITVTAARALIDALSPVGHKLVAVPENLIDIVWGDERPATPNGAITDHGLKYAGRSREEKIAELRTFLEGKKGAWGIVFSALDEIAWLFNLRGSDIAYNPVFFSYALVTRTECRLYVDASKLEGTLKKDLSSAGITIRAYEDFFSELQVMGAEPDFASQKLCIDPRCSFALQEILGGRDRVDESRSPVQVSKSIKNAAEIQGFRDCHVRDASALCEYFSWLEEELVVKKNKQLSEVDGADMLEQFRSRLDDFIGLSFDTISSTGPNGAIIHYKPSRPTCRMIDVDSIYLCDSGGQYRDGTTDVTRTMHFGTPTAREKDCYTRVLRGHMQLDMTVFPRGTTGYVLDVLSRTALWRAGLDFRHGTGHGVGSFLNVHEGPQGIGPRIGYNEVAMEAGMTITNEPGYYEDGAFGIRIENVMVVKEVETANNFGGRGYLGFEHVTVTPIQTKLVDVAQLLPEERDWLNRYNKECFEKVSPLLEKGSRAYLWLEKETKAI